MNMPIEATIKLAFRAIAAGAGLMASFSSLSAADVQDTYFEQFRALCGQAFAGAVVKDNLQDPRFSGAKIILHVRDCSDTEIRMPMHVGDDHSRTFILRKVANGLQFKHDHRHEDGSPDTVTLYGGTTVSRGSVSRQDFPADAETKVLFADNGLTVSLDNVWTVAVTPEKTISYALNRPNREFKIEFDLTNIVANPPKAWGAE